MTQAHQITPKQARKLALISQGIHRKSDFGRGLSASEKAIEHLGYLQIDTISVVERAHHHTLWNRASRYCPKYLDELLRDKLVFEYWSHAASYLPMRDYRFSLPRKHAFASGDQHWHAKDPKTIKLVLDRIKIEGPLQAKDFANSGPASISNWWDWKPAKRALEQLFMQGELMVSERRGFQKVYDLTERVLPDTVNTQEPDHMEYCDHLIERYLLANGVGRASEMVYLRKGLKPAIRQRCRDWLEDGRLSLVKVFGEEHYVLPSYQKVLKKTLSQSKVLILSPFDNLIIQRKRASQMFDFDYQLECYKPEEKRVYGYFVLPILWGNRFAARMDAKVDRKAGLFIIRHLSIEVSDVTEFLERFKGSLAEFLVFNSVSRLKVERITANNKPVSLSDHNKWSKLFLSP